MKTTIVPAQVTTVEDKVAGNLTLSQLLLLAAPAFIGTAIYIGLPPMLNMSPYKLVFTLLVAATFGLLAIRFKGKILLLWLVILARYNLRPRYYVFDKNDPHLRDMESLFVQEATQQSIVSEESEATPLPTLSVAESVRLEDIMANPKANLQFLTDKKGALRVHFTEVK